MRTRGWSIVALVLLVSLSAGPSRAQYGTVSPTPQFALDDIVVLPVDGASFLPGARFDLVIDIPAPDPDLPVSITLDGVPIVDALGEAPEQLMTAPGRGMLRWRGVTLDRAGERVLEIRLGDRRAVTRWDVREPVAGTARNVVLLVADGMTVAALSAARVMSRGLEHGRYRGRLAVDGMEEIGLVQTAALNSIISDSANTASAMNTGHKARVGSTGTYSDATADPTDDPRVETFGELIQRTRNMAIGVVTTAELNDATPAAVWAHCRDRMLICRAGMSRSLIDDGLQPQVLLGGGARWLRQEDAGGTVRDLAAEFGGLGYRVVRTATELGAAVADPERVPDRLFGVFHDLHLNVWLDRNVYLTNSEPFDDQPGLAAMTLAALQVLQRNPNGFYLMVEAASVDKMLHRADHERALADLIEFDATVAAVLAWVSEHAPDTLVIATSDHGHGFDVFGTVDTTTLEAAGDRRSKLDAIRIYDQAGVPDYRDADGDGYPDEWDVRITFAATSNNGPPRTEDYSVNERPRIPATRGMFGGAEVNPKDDPHGVKYSGNVPPGGASPDQSVHTLQDVPVFASGPGAERFGRSIDQIEIFFGMAHAIGLDPTRESGRVPQRKRTAPGD